MNDEMRMNDKMFMIMMNDEEIENTNKKVKGMMLAQNIETTQCICMSLNSIFQMTL